MKQYTIGVDFGSLSARAVLMDMDTGALAATADYDYPHGIMTQSLPDGTGLPPDWAVQDPQDYWNALGELIPAVLARAGVGAEQVAGVGLDTTSCTLLPTDAEGTPLCRLPGYAARPHAYIKLWKHHAAQKYADEITALAAARGEPWLAQFGGRVSCEHYLPKAAQIAAEDPELFRAAQRLPQLGDWLVWRLCGSESRSSCAAAFKAFYRAGAGDVDPGFLARVHPLLGELHAKQPAFVQSPGDCAGGLTERAARWTGLLPGTRVAVSSVDAHVTLLGCHMDEPGSLLLIVGTSTCEIVNSPVYREVEGISGVVPEAILPGLNAYEGGQACVGDMFAWFIQRCVPAAYRRQAEEAGVDIHRFLMEKSAALVPGESGVLALDWWNGARSVLMDFDLSGLMVGLTLDTTPEVIYRALLESTAFGAKRILQALEDSGVPIQRLYAAGGIPRKNPLLAQIYADVCNREVYLVEQEQTGALGSAILGAAAVRSGFRCLPQLIQSYKTSGGTVFRPIPEHVAVYRELYALYLGLYEQFGRNSALMKDLKKWKLKAGGR